MNVVVIGGSGLIGAKLVTKLRSQGHTVIAGSPRTGVDTVTGFGLAEALEGTETVVDVSNSASFEDAAVLEFFERSGRNVLAAEASSRVRHHVALSIVGVDRNLASGYMRGKMAQERLITEAEIPYTILRSTQFFEFLSSLAGGGTTGTVHISPALVQPIAADDVVAALAAIVHEAPLNGYLETAGPDRQPLNKFVADSLSARGDKRTVQADVHATYYGLELNDRSLTPGQAPRIGPTRFETWLRTERSGK